jgi:hypothetical protein
LAYRVVDPAPAAPKGSPVGPGRTTATSSRLLYEVLGGVYDWLGFDTVADRVFRDLVIARIVEPASRLDSLRVLADLGVDLVSYKTIDRHVRMVESGVMRSPGNACPMPPAAAG